MTASFPSNVADTVVKLLTTEEYHDICSRNLARYWEISISTSITVNLGAIFRFSSGDLLEDPDELACTPNLDTQVFGWQPFEGANAVVMEDSWTRYLIVLL
jgi:hypothetical protein